MMGEGGLGMMSRETGKMDRVRNEQSDDEGNSTEESQEEDIYEHAVGG
jgi:hypothetical protein